MVPGRDSAPGWGLGSEPAQATAKAQAMGSEMGQGSGQATD